MQADIVQAFQDARRNDQPSRRVHWIQDTPYLPSATVTDTTSLLPVVRELLELQQISLSPNPTIQSVSGGRTNTLYQVDGRFLVRLFGAPGLIDRDDETAWFMLIKIAPKYYGRFQNGRIEQFYANVRHLAVPELPRYANSIARELRKLHQQPIDASVPRKVVVWTQLFDWWNQACHDVQFPADARLQRRYEALRLAQYGPMLRAAQTAAQSYDFCVCFCHNDVLAANVVVHDDNTVLRLVDFEYGGLNYAEFDIANHFNEWAGGPPDTTEPDYTMLPNPSQQDDFIRAYLGYFDAGFRERVQFWVRLNHLFWGFWAVNQAYSEGCDEFDYLRYAERRLREYTK